MKAALINFHMNSWVRDYSMCNVRGVDHSDNPTENHRPLQQNPSVLLCRLGSFCFCNVLILSTLISLTSSSRRQLFSVIKPWEDPLYPPCLEPNSRQIDSSLNCAKWRVNIGHRVNWIMTPNECYNCCVCCRLSQSQDQTSPTMNGTVMIKCVNHRFSSNRSEKFTFSLKYTNEDSLLFTSYFSYTVYILYIAYIVFTFKPSLSSNV